MFNSDGSPSTEYVIMVGRRFLRQRHETVVVLGRQVEHAARYMTAADALAERDALRASSKKPIEVYSVATKRIDK